MGKRLRGTARDCIPYDALVLCRNGDVRLAPAEIANGVALPRPKWLQRWHGETYEPGEWLEVEMLDDLGERDLYAMANGPIMDPLRIYLPSGKVTEEEYQHRLALDYERAGIERP